MILFIVGSIPITPILGKRIRIGQTITYASSTVGETAAIAIYFTSVPRGHDCDLFITLWLHKRIVEIRSTVVWNWYWNQNWESILPELESAPGSIKLGITITVLFVVEG